ncbi:unnamed protein product [Urochloa humidicola]
MGGITQILGTAQARLVRLEVVVLLSAFILSILVLNRSVHRGFMGVVYSMSYVFVSYAVGLIQDGPFHDEAFVLWAAALLVIQASAMSTSETKALLLIKSAGRCEQECGHVQRKKLLLQHVLQTGLVLWLIVNTRSHNPCYQAAIWALWALSMLKTAAQIVEVTRADLPDPSVKALHDYMAVEEDLIASDEDDQRPPDPATMQGYRFIFHGEETMEPVNHDQDGRPVRGEMLAQSAARSVVKINQVYQWIDQQPYSDVEKDKPKDFCLAFALYKLLKRRFYGCDPAEAGSDKALGLVLTGLIHAGATGPDAAFRVAEVEVAFFYEFFYTRNIALQVLGPKTYICVTVAVACLTISSVLLGTLAPTYRPLLTGVRNLDGAIITVLIVVVTAGLEVYQAVASLSSNWRYVMAVYRCVRDDRPWTKRRRRHLWWKESITPPEIRYWEEKVGQYVLLKCYHHRPWKWNLLSLLTLYLVEPRRQGQKRGRREPLPPEVKRAVLLSLKQSHCVLSNGVVALRRHRLLPRLAWACRLPTLTDQILAWHVATTACEWDCNGGRPAGRVTAGDEHHRLVAMKLSNYCVYLVAFVPDMLPDASYNAKRVFDEAVQQARRQLEGCREENSILAKLNA